MSLPTVIDVGSCVIRAGSANPEEPPPVVTPACARDGASSRGAGGGLGPSVAALRRGSVASIDALEAVLEYALYDQLGWEYGDEGNVLLAERKVRSGLVCVALCSCSGLALSVSLLGLSPVSSYRTITQGSASGDRTRRKRDGVRTRWS